jgi:manganese/iron transport system ATP-binding protein
MVTGRIPFIRRPAVHRTEVPLLEASHLSVRFDGRAALEDVSFRLQSGERIAVVGPNGAGKSTLFKVIAGVLDPTSGNVEVAGHCPGGHICIAYLPQRSQVDWTFPVSVQDVVMMGRTAIVGLLRQPTARDWQYVQQSLQVVGMAEHADRQIGELSGGQQQRMFIARALAQEAELMLMDEPLTGLDVEAQGQIFAILEELSQRSVTVLVATHDLNLATERFDRVMLLSKRLLGIGAPDDVFTTGRLQQAYGGHLRLVRSDDGVMVLTDTCCGGDD